MLSAAGCAIVKARMSPHGEFSRSVALTLFTSPIHDLVSQRVTYTPAADQAVAWSQAFGSDFERDEQGSARGYNHQQAGFTLGYEQRLHRSRIGVMAGIVTADVSTQDTTNSTSAGTQYETETNSYYGGVYSSFALPKKLRLTGSLLAGYREHDNKRSVDKEIAESNAGSVFVSPSLTLSAVYPFTTIAKRPLELRPSLNVGYNVAWLEDYRESGSASYNLKVNERTVRAFTAQAQLAAAYQIQPGSILGLKVGVKTRNTNDDSIRTTYAKGTSTRFNYSPAGNNDVLSGYVGINLRYTAYQNLHLLADVTASNDSDDDESQIAGGLSFDYRF